MSDYSYEEQKAIGEKVKDRISALGFTRAQVAEESKISVASLRMIINGQKYPTGPQIKRLCATLKITPNYLLFGTENPNLLKGDSEEEIAYEILKTSYLKSKLDRDSSAMIDRLILSMLSDQYKKTEYGELIDFADYFSNTLSVYIAPTIAAIARTDISKAKDNKERARLLREGLAAAKTELRQDKSN